MRAPRKSFIAFGLFILAIACADKAPEPYSPKKLKSGSGDVGKDDTKDIPPDEGSSDSSGTEKHLYREDGSEFTSSYVPKDDETVSCSPQTPAFAEFIKSCEKKGYQMVPTAACESACTGNVKNPVLSKESSLPKTYVDKTVYDEKWQPFPYKLVEEQGECSPLLPEEAAAYAKFVDSCVQADFNLLISGSCSVACTGLPKMDPPKEEDPWKGTVMDPGTAGDGDFTIGPDYKDSPDIAEKAGVAKGTVREFSMNSKDSKIYRGEDGFLTFKGAFTRKGWIYTPAGYKNDKELPFMVVGDGGGNKDLMSKVLNNLIAAKKIPPMMAVFINPGVINGKGDGPGSQRSFEYDNVTPDFGDFIETEVLPKLTKDFGVKFITNPEGRGTMGCSSGGAMAFTAAWFKPDKYRRVLTYSGTFVNRIKTDEHPQGAWEYHQKIIPMAEKKPIRVVIHASENDNNFGSDNNWKVANQTMASVFKEKGYHYRFLYSKATGHCDGKVIRQTLPESMIWLWRGYPIP